MLNLFLNTTGFKAFSPRSIANMMSLIRTPSTDKQNSIWAVCWAEQQASLDKVKYHIHVSSKFPFVALG